MFGIYNPPRRSSSMCLGYGKNNHVNECKRRSVKSKPRGKRVQFADSHQILYVATSVVHSYTDSASNWTPVREYYIFDHFHHVIQKFVTGQFVLCRTYEDSK